MSIWIGKISLALSLLVGLCPVLVLADPPAHAPAHGWRMKHDPNYRGYSGKQWPTDYGVLSGRCNREAVATVLGGVAGAAIGSRVGDGDDRAVAMIIGAAAGALIGNRIGRELDEADRACVGHALEVAETGQTLTWVNESTGVAYEMTVLADSSVQDDACRKFALAADLGKTKSSRQGRACHTAQGLWEVDGKNIRALVTDEP